MPKQVPRSTPETTPRKLHGRPVRIVKSTRRKKTISVQIVDDAIVIRVPEATTAEQIQRVLDKQSNWIAQTIAKQQARPQYQKNEDDWKHNLLYQGIPLSLTYQIQPKWTATKKGQELLITGPAKDGPSLRQITTLWYRREAEVLIRKRLQYWTIHLDASYNMVRIKDIKSRWGSCSSKRNLNFNWRLVCVPQSVLDYVIVHELCHLQEMNHSSRFWKLVEKVLPDFRQQRDWLKQHGETLYF